MSTRQVLQNVLWKLGERGGVQIVQFVAQIVLARILTPQDYGTLAIVLVFINLANIFVQSGLPTALIQKKEIDKTDTSTVFFASLGIAILFIIVIWLCSPFVADVYQDTNIILYLRVASFVLLVGAFNSIQIAFLSRKLQFKKNFYSSIGGIIVATAISIYMALHGFGVWSLVVNYAINIIVSSIILYIINPWLPSLTFSYKRFKQLYSYGSKLLAANLISTFFTDLYALIIGKRYTKVWLGYYENGNRIPAVASNALTTAVQSVLLPVMSGAQDDAVRMKSMMRRSVQISALLIFPVMGLLIVCAEPLVQIVLTDKWIKAVPFLQLSALSCAIFPIQVINLQAVNAIGRSDIFMKCEIKKKIVELIILCITVWFSIYIMAFGKVISSVIALFINIAPNKKYIFYGLKEQLNDIIPSLIITFIMVILVYPIGLIIESQFISIIVTSLVGFVSYTYITIKFNKNSLQYLKSSIIRTKTE